jgi:hypothetical protein
MQVAALKNEQPTSKKSKTGNPFDAGLHRNYGFKTINRIFGAFVWTHALAVGPPRSQGDLF